MATRGLDFVTAEYIGGKGSGNLFSFTYELKSTKYDEVRKAILKAYELVPEAYHQKFRDSMAKLTLNC